jgi:purine-binding chemotaxis protein CheW
MSDVKYDQKPNKSQNDDQAPDDAQVLVTLMLGDQLCGIPVRSVRDVLGPQKITRIPLTPPEIAGSLNLRGRIVTAVDLRLRLGLPSLPAGSSRMSVVTDIGGELYALLVDSVAEVLDPPSSSFEENPPTLPKVWARYSNGIYRLSDRLLVVLDISRLLNFHPEQV